ncbi:putative transposase [Caldanaerobius fijiensis DSM 17918]|uniref:Putative transposase n=1 Tax=Caldanaerobius fijiensis DSM 17918 TaxID=1121256 RepID=A0A1M5CLM5_9THEO|nr:hypothetical protein [Caldanaerobius fijiensis]SHF55664.1 putative transposase [Caldanaerobius fijiensis DSM 17918]
MGWAKKKGKQQEGRLYLTKVIPLKGEEWLDKFREPMLAATKIWNSCVWESKQAAKEGREYPTESELKAKFKHYQSWKKLHSKSAQGVVENYFEAVRSKENGHDEMRPPSYKSKHLWRTIKWKNGNKAFEYKNNAIALKFSRKMESVTIPLPKGANMLILSDGTKLNGTPIEVKVKAVYRKKDVSHLQLHVTWDYGIIPVSVSEKVSAYDINSAAIARTSTEEAGS